VEQHPTGNYSNVVFQAGTHNQYDQLVLPFAVIGNGVDVEVGCNFQGNKYEYS
jgi:hypothetical protein